MRGRNTRVLALNALSCTLIFSLPLSGYSRRIYVHACADDASRVVAHIAFQIRPRRIYVERVCVIYVYTRVVEYKEPTAETEAAATTMVTTSKHTSDVEGKGRTTNEKENTEEGEGRETRRKENEEKQRCSLYSLASSTAVHT